MSPPGRILALDVGDKRIGVAVSDPLQIVARPLTVVRRAARTEDFAQIGRLVEEQDAVRIVCGYPLSLDGTEGPQGRRVRRYAEVLDGAIAAPVVLWNESYSTIEADEVMQATRPGLSPRERREWVDAVAAAVILQSYLNAQSAPAPPPPPHG
jgi:putative Holliday junction resolvase